MPKMDKGGLKSAESAMAGAGTNSGNQFSANFNGVLKKLAGAAVFAEAGKLIGQTFATAFNEAARNEQLIGGVETLFGEEGSEAYRVVTENASKAFAEAGVSANDYMEQVSSFSASLINSLGGDTIAAANVADIAMRDMSDNANKMGSSIESIQNAYQGFAKGNFTMLDNLKLGYGGTKEEMQRLLDRAEELTGKTFNIDNFADITEAIHAVQDEMGIAGVTLEESETTVEGSLNRLSASWTNFLTGLGTGKDVERLASELVDSFGNAVKLVIPMAVNVFKGMVSALPDVIAEMMPLVADGITQVIDMLPTFIPALMSSAVNLFMGLVNAIPTIAMSLLGAIGNLLQQGWSAISSFDLSGAASNMIQGLVNGLLAAPRAVADALIQIAQNAKDAFCEFWGINSPSKVMGELGVYMGQGLVSGIDSQQDNVQRSMTGLVSSAYGDAPSYRGFSQGGMAGGVVYNVYVNGAVVNSDSAIQDSMYSFLTNLQRRAAM
ncbi:MAG: hypothetical protein KBT28_12420 [Bacteroidales bacterium]|nr:hypothetical protein [Candidatus Colimorpha merdihippi]